MGASEKAEATYHPDIPPSDAAPGDIVHACPPGTESLTPCCGRSPFELMADRMTIYPEYVTCKTERQDHTTP